jgi:NAD(P)-dependent dehydrogenase (short-subunit alcohol dehydrogenase family)
LDAALCRRFAMGGLHVFVAGRTQEKIDAIAAEIHQAGGTATAFFMRYHPRGSGRYPVQDGRYPWRRSVDRALDLEKVVFGEGQVALRFGRQKINLQAAGNYGGLQAPNHLPGTLTSIYFRDPENKLVEISNYA